MEWKEIIPKNKENLETYRLNGGVEDMTPEMQQYIVLMNKLGMQPELQTSSYGQLKDVLILKLIEMLTSPKEYHYEEQYV